MTDKLEKGKTYQLTHSRFGTATVTVTHVGDEWIDVLIVDGRLVGLNDEWLPGDTKTVRASHCEFKEKP
jgi:hypothetical protein